MTIPTAEQLDEISDRNQVHMFESILRDLTTYDNLTAFVKKSLIRNGIISLRGRSGSKGRYPCLTEKTVSILRDMDEEGI